MSYLLNIALSTALLSLPLTALDLGVHGTTYSIAEEDLRTLIIERLDELSLEQFNEELREAIQRIAHEPRYVDGITKATEYRCFSHDPSVILSSDIRDHNGRLLYPQGTEVHPFDYVDFQTTFLFFDATDPDQLDWARDQDPNAKWVLVGGSAIALGEEEKRPVFFDQGGALCHRFHIEHVPARVVRCDRDLWIEEFAVGEGE